jgi:hypothetical protein
MLRSEGDNVHQAYAEARNRIEQAYRREADSLASITRFVGAPTASIRPWAKTLEPIRDSALAAAKILYEELCEDRGLKPRRTSALVSAPVPEAGRIPLRTDNVKGPTGIYYYDHLAERLGAEEAATALGSEASYEILNFVDGRRTVEEIRNAVSAELEPVPLEDVIEYLDLLEKAEVIRYRER